MMFKDGKVYAAVDDDGNLVAERGLVKIRYRKDDDREYSAHADAIEEVDEDKIAAARARKKSAKKKSAGKKSAGKATSGSASQSASASTDSGPVGGFPSAAATARIVDENEVPDDAVTVYTDGACFSNPGPMGAGVVLIWGDNRREISTYLGHGTNNLAELHAVRLALEAITKRDLPVRIFIDSSYVIGLLARGWKAKENREVVADLRKLAAEFSDLALVKVKGHAGIELNEVVDQLAKKAAEKGR